MWGVKLRYVRIGVLLSAAVGFVLSWRYLGQAASVMIAAVVILIGLTIVAGRNAWRQTDQKAAAAAARWVELDGDLRRDMTGLVVPKFRGRPAPPAPAWAAQPPQRPSRPRTRQARQARESRQPRRGTEMLQPDATVTLAEERRAAGIDDIFAALDTELVGLVPVKKKVAEIGSLLLVDRARQRFGLSAARPNLHMSFTGPPGTGKTTVALKLADLLHRLGYLEQGHLVHAMRDDLVGEYIGHTAPKTKQVLDRAMGGVLFIDEAYTLFRAGDSKDYGQECVDILLQVMENDRDKLVVILAGYKDRMDRFFDSNPGMSSRIAHHLDFAAYDPEELLAIGQLMLGKSSYYLSDEATAAFRDYVSLRMRQPRFSNARSVRNELERARLRHAYRLAADPERNRSKDDLMRLEAADILLSPVFAQAQAELR